MEFGPFSLPTLALLILISLVFVTAAWVFDGTKPEAETDILKEEDEAEAALVDKRDPPKGPLPRY